MGRAVSKKRLVIAAICVCAVAVIAGMGIYFANQNRSKPSWSFIEDDSLDVLTMQVAGGNVVAMAGDGWVARDGYIQLQLSGSSIPGQAIDSISQDGSELTVTLQSDGDASSTDLLLTEYRLQGGDVSSIKRVLVDYGTGDVEEIQEAYE